MSVSMHRLVPVALMLGASAFLVLAASTQSKDPFLGKWALDSEHSKFAPGAVPMNRTMTLDLMNGGLHSLTATVQNNGGTATIEFTAKFDGHDYPVYGSDLDTVSLKRDSPTEIERTGKVRGNPSETCTMQLSPDDKTLTMTIKGAYQGTQYSSTQIYKRQ